MCDRTLAEHFLKYSAMKLNEHFGQISRCAAMLSADQVWYRPNESSNSVGNLLLHLRGNIRQWIVGGIGGAPIERDRQAEFDRREPIGTEKLVDDLRAAVDESIAVLERSGPETLLAIFAIQEYKISGIGAVLHVVEHFAFHTGQIITTTKWLLDCDLSLYDERGHRRDGRDAGVP